MPGPNSCAALTLLGAEAPSRPDFPHSWVSCPIQLSLEPRLRKCKSNPSWHAGGWDLSPLGPLEKICTVFFLSGSLIVSSYLLLRFLVGRKATNK